MEFPFLVGNVFREARVFRTGEHQRVTRSVQIADNSCCNAFEMQTRRIDNAVGMQKRRRPSLLMAAHIGRICLTMGLIVCLLASLACPVALAAEGSKRVMLLHSFGRDFKPWDEYAKTIRSELDRQSPWPLDITDHSLVSARSSDEDPEGPFVEYLRALFAKRPLDLIVSIGAPAAKFVQRHRERLFTATPMVFTAVEQRRVQYSKLTENDAVVAVWIDYPAAFDNILQLLPDTKNIAIVVGTSPIEKFWTEEIARGAAACKPDCIHMVQ